MMLHKISNFDYIYLFNVYQYRFKLIYHNFYMMHHKISNFIDIYLINLH
jgi:hypothetical protein